MALSSLLMHEVCKRLRPGMRVASVGYPDIVAPLIEVKAILGERFKQLRYRDDSDAIRKWHGGEGRIPDAYSFFELQAASLDVFDIAVLRGGEIILDFNYPITDAYTERYDALIDVGSAEHCFNIGTAIKNMATMLGQGGFVFHENPANWFNHGFWNINPTVYADFYGQDGFALRECWLVPRGQEPIRNVERKKRFAYQGPEANMIAVAERVKVLPVEWVVQGKYKSMIAGALPAAAGHPGESQKEKELA